VEPSKLTQAGPPELDRLTSLSRRLPAARMALRVVAMLRRAGRWCRVRLQAEAQPGGVHLPHTGPPPTHTDHDLIASPYATEEDRSKAIGAQGNSEYADFMMDNIDYPSKRCLHETTQCLVKVAGGAMLSRKGTVTASSRWPQRPRVQRPYLMWGERESLRRGQSHILRGLTRGARLHRRGATLRTSDGLSFHPDGWGRPRRSARRGRE
jgi:hypothetical protein